LLSNGLFVLSELRQFFSFFAILERLVFVRRAGNAESKTITVADVIQNEKSPTDFGYIQGLKSLIK